MLRRTVLSALTTTLGLVMAGIVGIPALITSMSPLFERRRGPVWRPVGAVADFLRGTITPAAVEVPRDDWARSLSVQRVYVWHGDDGDLVVFSRNCTDLSCPVVWDPRSQRFYCPCHGGIFAMNGDPLAGPPARPLFRYRNRTRNGRLEIDLSSLPAIT
jgi:menaquinol-cytochrome c reductase iron-sulfur subunit